MSEQAAKHARFSALHQRPGAFVMPNPWDAGSARLLASLGFEALATTSAGYAFSVDGSGRVHTGMHPTARADALRRVPQWLAR